ncbi:MAG: metal-sulfur cluster assembly factor [Sulfuritalea sp.]|nr:metal-sulfur cluster assembly factor [Sulfuritalea sp.]
MANDTPKPLPDAAAVRKLLHRVIDPEAGLNIVDLGLVYRVDVAPERVVVDMTMTSPACPLGEMITDEVKDVLAHALPANCTAEVRLVWEPPWDPSMMSEAGKQHFGWTPE